MISEDIFVSGIFDRVGVTIVSALVFLLAIAVLYWRLRQNRIARFAAAESWENSYEGLRYQTAALTAYGVNLLPEHAQVAQPVNFQLSSPPPRQQPLIFPADQFLPHDELTRPVPIQAAASGALANLVYVGGGDHLPQAYVIMNGKVQRFGRSKRYCEHVIDDLRISRNHASIRCIDGTFYLQDEGSSGGTFVNQSKLRISDQRQLENGDIINFNEISYRFQQHNKHH